MNIKPNKKGKTPKEKNATKIAKPTQNVQGFLLPKDYKNQIQWKENPIYRATFLLLLLTIVWSVVSIPRWFFSDQWEKAAADLQTTSLNESEWISASLKKIRPIRNKYKEIEEILQYRRIPLSPVLSALQTYIPKNISLNKIEWETTLGKTTKNLDVTGKRQQDKPQVNTTAREATLRLEVYANQNWKNEQKEKSTVGWLINLEKEISKLGIKIKERNIGTETPYIVAKTSNTNQSTSIEGYITPVTLRLELEGPKMEEATPKKLSKPKTNLPTKP